MAISYPLALPTNIGIASIQLRAVNAVAYSRSPFTFAGQAHTYSGEAWEADVTLPPMNRADAEAWISFLVSLRGQHGTFRLHDPSATSPRGNATSMTITGAAGDRTVSATVTSTKTLKAGDYFSIVSGGSYRLHKVLQDYIGTGSAANLEIWPALRSAYTNIACDLTTAEGQFRLTSNEQAWTVNSASVYGITFGAMEAL